MRTSFQLARRSARYGLPLDCNIPWGNPCSGSLAASATAGPSSCLQASEGSACSSPERISGPLQLGTLAQLCRQELLNRTTSGRSASTSAASSTNAEVAKFSALADQWWNPEGPFAPLISLTPVRTLFIRRALCQNLGLQELSVRPFDGKAILDVGCGGGLLSESLARLGATVTGIDLSDESIRAATAHADADRQIRSLIKYRSCSAEQVLEEGPRYDAVIASEVIEHVDNPGHFCQTLAALTRNNGAVVVSTLSRTARAYAVAILGAEVITGALPRGTHDWNKFLTPEDLVLLTEGTQLALRQIAGMSLDLLSGRWSLTQDLAVNYIACFQKQPAVTQTGR